MALFLCMTLTYVYDTLCMTLTYTNFVIILMNTLNSLA